jgi:hypothetical protein
MEEKCGVYGGVEELKNRDGNTRHPPPEESRTSTQSFPVAAAGPHGLKDLTSPLQEDGWTMGSE